MNDKMVVGVHWSFRVIAAVALVAAVSAQVPFLTIADFLIAAWIGWSSQVLVGAFLIWYSLHTKSKAWINQIGQ